MVEYAELLGLEMRFDDENGGGASDRWTHLIRESNNSVDYFLFSIQIRKAGCERTWKGGKRNLVKRTSRLNLIIKIVEFNRMIEHVQHTVQ